MKKTIICGSCGAAILIATHAVSAMPIHMAPGHDAISIAKEVAQNQNVSVLVVGTGLHQEVDSSIERLLQIRLHAILEDEIFMPAVEIKKSKKRKSSPFPFGRKSKYFPQKVSGKLGQKIGFHIRQPRNKSSAYKHRRKVVEK